MKQIDRKLSSLVKKYQKLRTDPVPPGERRATAQTLQEIRKAQDELLDQRLAVAAQEEAERLEALLQSS